MTKPNNSAALEIAAVKHFLGKNRLRTLKFDFPSEEFERSIRLYNAVPIYIRNFKDSCTVLYIERFLYNPGEQILIIRADELLKHL